MHSGPFQSARVQGSYTPTKEVLQAGDVEIFILRGKAP